MTGQTKNKYYTANVTDMDFRTNYKKMMSILSHYDWTMRESSHPLLTLRIINTTWYDCVL